MNSVTLPWPPKELRPKARIHWSKKARAAKKYLADCYYLAKQDLFPVEWEGPIKLKITFSPPDARHRDMDNMAASIKSGLDGLAMALGVNDKRFSLQLEIAPINQGRVVVEILQ